MTEFKSAYAGMTGFAIAELSRAERERRWSSDRQSIADIWFGGDAENAQAAFDALPYSRIPDWEDLDEVCRAVRASADVEDGRHS